MKTASTEREAIVAWLRGPMQDKQLGKSLGHYAKLFADLIERGEHLKDQDHGRA